MDQISRMEAHAVGKNRYFTGVPCIRGHVCERYVTNGGCVDCINFKVVKRARVFAGAPQALPEVPFHFDIEPRPNMKEMMAALYMMQACNWHVKALQQMRENPELFNRYRGTQEERKLAGFGVLKDEQPV